MAFGNSKPLITMDRITVRLRDRFLLADTSWVISEGDNWAVIGPNGAGKTTLVKALAGELPVVKGRILYHWVGDGPAGASAARRAIELVSFNGKGLLFERDEVLGSLGYSEDEGRRRPSVAQLMAAAASAAAKPEGRVPELRETARRLALEQLLDRDVGTLSIGEARRILIACALMRSPRILILDEPFECLDRASREAIKEAIEGLAEGSITLVLVTHSLQEIGENISHVISLRGCSIYEQGRREEMLKPEKVRALYGYPKAPELPGELATSRGTEGGGPPGRILVRIKDACVSYGGRVVLQGIDWCIRKGENWAVLGPNGSGKTKLLQLITGDNLQSYSNEVYLFGRRRGTGESLWEIRSAISVVSSEYQIHYQKGTSAYDVVCSGFFDSVGLYRNPTEEQHREAGRWIRLLGISGLAEKRMDQLSYGQQRLILLARAVVKSPVLLLLDDPCEGLDPANRRKILSLIEFIGSATMTNLVYVTHHENELPDCITHVIILDRGRVIGKGPRKSMFV